MIVVVDIREERLPRPVRDKKDFPIILREEVARLISLLREKFNSINFVYTTKTGKILPEHEIMEALAGDGYIYVYKTSRGPSIKLCALVIRVPTYMASLEDVYRYHVVKN